MRECIILFLPKASQFNLTNSYGDPFAHGGRILFFLNKNVYVKKKKKRKVVSVQ